MCKLLENYGDISTDKELQNLQEKHKTLDAFYVKYSCNYNSVSHIATKNKIEEIYDKIKKDKDKDYLEKDFKTKFQKNFSERLWEMFLIYVFLEKGFQIEKQNSETGPDIKIKLNNGKTLWIEATVANRGDGENKVSEIQLNGLVLILIILIFPKY